MGEKNIITHDRLSVLKIFYFTVTRLRCMIRVQIEIRQTEYVQYFKMIRYYRVLSKNDFTFGIEFVLSTVLTDDFGLPRNKT